MAPADFVTALDRTDQIELRTVGRVTGRPSSRPVWFVRDGMTLYLLPVDGTDSNWYRNVVHTPTVQLTASAVQADVTGNPITDPGRVAGVIDEFRAKYGADDVASYYPRPEVAVEVPLG
jgi:hypothetical protein